MESHNDGFPRSDEGLMTRAALLRRGFGAAVLLGGAGSLLAACGGGGGSGETSAPSATGGGTTGSAAGGNVSGTVTFLGWQGYDDKEAAKPLFDKGVTLATTYITNNDEILTKLRGGGLGTIDVVTPYFGYIKPMVEAELLQPLDYSRLPSTASYFPEFMRPSWNTFDGETYSAPLVWADTPIVYREDLVPELPESWLDLKDPLYKGTLVTLDDPLGNIIIFSKALFGPDDPTRITKEQLDGVISTMNEIKPNLVTVAASFGDIADLLARGDASLCITGWRFLEVQLADKGEQAASYVPKEGTFAWCDNYCIPKEAPNDDATYAFIETMISTAGNAIVAGNTGSAVTNSAAVTDLPQNQAGLYPYDDISSFFSTTGLYALPPLEPDGDIATFPDWQTAWQQFKTT